MHLRFLTPFPPQPGGGTAFNEGIVPALRALGHVIVEEPGDDAPDATPVIDGMVLPALEPEFDTLLDRDAIAVVHHVSAAAGQDAGARETVRAAEHRMLPRIRRVVASSAPVAERLLAEFGVTATVVTPGLADLPRATAAANGPCRIFAPGVLTKRKGHHRLLHALARLTDLDWTLLIAGDARRDPVHAGTIAALIDDLRLGARTTLLPDPSPDALNAAWQTTDLFALASEWEGWPQSAAEALRRGVPLVAYRVPSLEALVPAAAGLLVPQDDPATFGKTLRRAIFDRPLRASLADAAWQAGTTLAGWPQQALAFDAILRS